MQGVLRKGEKVSAGRWKWDAEKRKWELAVGVGEMVVPDVAGELRAGKTEVKGGEVFEGSDGLKWTVVESMRWSDE